MSELKFHVGQELWRHNVNESRRGGAQRVTVTKVARKLVTVEVYGRPETYRIDTGRRNDGYQHEWLCTDDEHADHTARAEVMQRLRSLRVSFDMGGYDRRYSTATLNAVADLLEATDSGASE